MPCLVFFFSFADYDRMMKLANLFSVTIVVTFALITVFVAVVLWATTNDHQLLTNISYGVEALLILFGAFQVVYIFIAKSLPNPSGRIRYEVGVNGTKSPVIYAPMTPRENRQPNLDAMARNDCNSSQESKETFEDFSNVCNEYELYERPITSRSFSKQGNDRESKTKNSEPATSGLQPSKQTNENFSAFYQKADSDNENHDSPKLDHQNLFSPSIRSFAVCAKVEPKSTAKAQS